MADPDSTFRLVFESDLTGEPAVRERVDAVMHACTVASPTSSPRTPSSTTRRRMLLAAGLTGAAQVAARWWLTQDGSLDRASGRGAGRVAGLARHQRVPSRRRGARRLA